MIGLLLLAGCPGGVDDTAVEPVIEGPVLDHAPVAGLEEGEALPVQVKATDLDGVVEVRLFFRTVGEPVWEPLVLDRDGETWSGTVPGAQVEPPGLQYYLRAEDGSELRTVSTLPEAGQQGPFEVPVQQTGRAIPFTEGFEGASIALFDLGWSVYALGFAANGWELATARSHEGEASAGHRRDAAGLPAVDDWLVSPALDLSAPGRLQVSWHETGDHVELATHSLWISTGSPDPADGEFEKVADLPSPPEEDWGRSPVVDLSAYEAVGPAWLAWRYEGERADAWYVDDVEVRALGPDLHLADWSFTRVEPGGQATITLDLENRTAVPALDLVVAGSSSAGVFGPAVEVEELADDVSVDLVLAVDAAHLDDSYLPFTVTATSGDEVWTWDLKLVVGDPTLASITVDPAVAGLVQGWIGVGDPIAPTYEQVAFSEILGVDPATFQADLTGLGLPLPPGPGPERWYLRVVSGVQGELDAFSITHDGQVHEGDDLGAWAPDLGTVYYLPRPPVPVVVPPDEGETTTDPHPVSPGDTVTWTLTLANEGTPTVGATTVTVTSDDPDVVVVTSAPQEIAADGWAPGTEVEVQLTVEVLETQVDGLPLRFDVEVEDRVESFVTPAEIDVPWPVLHATAIRVDDPDGDGLPEVDGETIEIEIDVTNIGTADTGTLSCTLAPDGAAPVVVHDGSHTGPPIPAGSTGLDCGLPTSSCQTANFAIELTGGNVGDPVGLVLTCADALSAWDLDPGLVVAEAPWIALAPFDDAAGDAQDYPFDLRNGRYRFDGELLHLELTSWTAYDPQTLFVEMWGESPGAPWAFYQLVGQSGVGTLRGYEFGFTRLSPDPTVTVIDDTTVRLSFSVDAMGLDPAGGRYGMSAGFAAGFCGGESYYCDRLPEGWGDPFQNGLNTDAWLRMEW